MKKYLIITIMFVVSLCACKKNELKPKPLASLMVTNAVIGGKFARLNSNLRDSCGAMSYKEFLINAGNSSEIKLFASSTPNNPYFNLKPDTEDGGIYSVYLTGTHELPDGFIVKDVIPPYAAVTDSIIRVRMVNLSPDLGVVNVTLLSEPSTNQYTGLSYKTASEFKNLPFKTLIPSGSNVFQIRDTNGNVKLTYTLPSAGTISITSSRFRNIALVIKGSVTGTGTNALGIIAVPYY